MKIALIGATGNIGSEIAQQAVQRGHTVTAVTRRTSGLPPALAGVDAVVADSFDTAALTAAIRGHDVLASAFGPGPDSADLVIKQAEVLIAAARAAGVKRVVMVGGAGSLLVAPGVQLVDAPGFPDMYRPYAIAHRNALAVLRAATDIDWTFFAPAAEIGPGDKLGQFRVGRDSLISDAAGNSKISYADYGDAFVTELETAAHRQQVVTAAY
ncbi:NAD(P)-dependent oxidoreductase [Undibacterium sp. TJN25]|uniref:NAD(P)-dependent oxidoreductase n=1 Tax=Undibacterium sp. TJN25 TaxID=3413056 RepID=UPI003BEFA653